jgi:hypothetical protein
LGGHFTEPYEQKTQQSPGFGLKTLLQFAHWWKNWQASIGITSSLAKPQCGQVITDLVNIERIVD